MVPATGQTNSYATGDDGDLEKGVTPPNPRFTIQANTNAVRDNLTGLVWTRNANMAANTAWSDSGGTSSWANAFSVCTNANGLVYGGRTDWRVPHAKELQSLQVFDRVNPCIQTGHPFLSVVNGRYWSSTTYSGATTFGIFVGFAQQESTAAAKTTGYYVWLCAGP
jgi:hypothetical protein